MSDEARQRRASTPTRIIRPGDPPPDEWEDLLRIPMEERFEIAWQLSREQWALAKENADEPQPEFELHRSIEAVFRR